MFDLSWSEILLVLAVAILVIKPEDVPQVMRTLGKAVGKVKRAARDFMHYLEAEVDLDEVKSFKKELEEEQEKITKIVDLEGNLQETFDLSDIEDDLERPLKHGTGRK